MFTKGIFCLAGAHLQHLDHDLRKTGNGDDMDDCGDDDELGHRGTGEACVVTRNKGRMIDRQTDRLTDRQIDRQTDRETDKPVGRLIDKQTNR